MKQIIQVEQVKVLDVNKEAEILAFINKNWLEFETAHDMAKFIMEGYIFGTFAENQHMNIDEILALIKQVDLEKNPVPVVVEPVVDTLTI